MEVKKFESFSLQDAIKLVKLELGRDAVILSTKEKEIYSEDMGKNCKIYEVTAAPNATMFGKIINSKAGVNLPKVDFPRIKSPNEAFVVKGEESKYQAQLKSSLASLHPQTRQMAKTLANTLQKDDFKDTNRKNISQQQPVEKVDNRDLELMKTELSRVRRDLEQLPQIDVTDQIQEIKVLLHDIMREKYRKTAENSNSHIVDIGVRLRTAGVSENFISQLCTWLNNLEEPRKNEELISSSEKTKDFYISSTIKFMFKYLKVSGPFRNESNKKRIICLIGPTGVGKTTTIAKIAAKLKVSEKKNVKLISMDSYRIVAADQLRVYSKILDCHFSEVSDKNELISSINKNSDYDFIFIDTAGRNIRFSEQMDFLNGLSKIPFPIEFHLVLSCTMKQRDIDETIRGYKSLNISSLIFTKLDESWAFGEILNSSVKNKIPLSYFTTGQRVPEDLEIASKERVVERLLKL